MFVSPPLPIGFSPTAETLTRAQGSSSEERGDAYPAKRLLGRGGR